MHYSFSGVLLIFQFEEHSFVGLVWVFEQTNLVLVSNYLIIYSTRLVLTLGGF